MLLEQLEAEVGRGDCHGVQCSAHALKGALQSIQAVPAARAAAATEQFGRSGDIECAAESLVTLKNELQRVTTLLSEQQFRSTT
jgi:HPt (histidine-containing phosphotransfer) domain-containing protein